MRSIPGRRRLRRLRGNRGDASAEPYSRSEDGSDTDPIATRYSSSLAARIGYWFARTRGIRGFIRLGRWTRDQSIDPFHSWQPLPCSFQRRVLRSSYRSRSGFFSAAWHRRIAATRLMNANEPIIIAGHEQSLLDPSLADGGLPPAVGVQSFCVFRASRAVPEITDRKGWTYHHHVDMA